MLRQLEEERKPRGALLSEVPQDRGRVMVTSKKGKEADSDWKGASCHFYGDRLLSWKEWVEAL